MIDRYNARKPFVGNLFLTSSHLIFKDPEYRKEVWVSLLKNLPLQTKISFYVWPLFSSFTRIYQI